MSTGAVALKIFTGASCRNTPLRPSVPTFIKRSVETEHRAGSVEHFSRGREEAPTASIVAKSIPRRLGSIAPRHRAFRLFRRARRRGRRSARVETARAVFGSQPAIRDAQSSFGSRHSMRCHVIQVYDKHVADAYSGFCSLHAGRAAQTNRSQHPSRPPPSVKRTRPPPSRIAAARSGSRFLSTRAHPRARASRTTTPTTTMASNDAQFSFSSDSDDEDYVPPAPRGGAGSSKAAAPAEESDMDSATADAFYAIDAVPEYADSDVDRPMVPRRSGRVGSAGAGSSGAGPSRAGGSSSAGAGSSAAGAAAAAQPSAAALAAAAAAPAGSGARPVGNASEESAGAGTEAGKSKEGPKPAEKVVDKKQVRSRRCSLIFFATDRPRVFGRAFGSRFLTFVSCFSTRLDRRSTICGRR